MTSDKTMIEVQKSTVTILKLMGAKGENYDTILKRLIGDNFPDSPEKVKRILESLPEGSMEVANMFAEDFDIRLTALKKSITANDWRCFWLRIGTTLAYIHDFNEEKLNVILKAIGEGFCCNRESS